MSYTVESVNSCTKKFVFKFDTVDLTAEIKNALVEKQKNVNLKGYRKGKVPFELLRKLYGAQAENEALYQFISTQFYDALKSEKLRPIGYPEFSNTQYKTSKEVSFDAVVEIFPEIEVQGLDKVKITKEKIEVSNDDLERNKRNYLNSKAEMKEVEDAEKALVKGDFAVINFQGERPDGERPENMKGSEYLLEIGSNYFIPGFEDALLGMKKGQKRTIDLTFPMEYHEKALQGQKVKFDVELLEIKVKRYPDFTEELAKEFGYESVEDFNKKSREALLYQKQRSYTEKLHKQILDQLIEKNNFEVPKSLIQNQKTSIENDLKSRFKEQGLGDANLKEYFEKWHSDIDTQAVNQVKSGLILDKLAKDFNIEVSESDIEAKFSEMAKHAGISVDEVKNYYNSNNNLKQNLTYAIREEKTFERILQKIG